MFFRGLKLSDLLHNQFLPHPDYQNQLTTVFRDVYQLQRYKGLVPNSKLDNLVKIKSWEIISISANSHTPIRGGDWHNRTIDSKDVVTGIESIIRIFTHIWQNLQVPIR